MSWDIALVRRLQHQYRHFDLAVSCRSAAQRLVLFGPSGAGKTVTLKMVAGLLRPDSGHVRVAGVTLFDSVQQINLSPQSRRLAYVFQDYALFPHLTVRQNIAFALRTGWRNPARGAASEAVDHWIEAFALQPLQSHYPHQISGGQKQRTALARALVAQPRALLLDEPFAALDKVLRQRLREQLAQLLADIRIPMLLITHDDDDVTCLGDDVVFVANGRVVTRAQAQEALVE